MRAPAGHCWPPRSRCPGVVPGAAHAQAAPDKGIFELQYLSYRDWQPGMNRMTVTRPLLRAAADQRYRGSSKAAWSTTRCPARRRCSSTRFRGRRSVDYRTAGDLKVTKYYDGYAVSVGGFVSSEQDFLSRGGSLNVQIFSDDRNRTWTLGVAGTNDRINADERRRAQLAAQLARVSGRHDAGADPQLDHPVEPHVLHRPRLLLRPVQVARHAPVGSPYVGVAHALQPVFPRSRRDVEARLPAAVRFVRQHVEHDRGGMGAGAALRIHGDARPALLHAERRGLLLQSAVAAGLRGEGSLYTADTRLAAFGAITAGVIVGKTLWDGWNVSLRADYYRQDPDWRIGGSGSPGIQTFPRAGSRSISPRRSERLRGMARALRPSRTPDEAVSPDISRDGRGARNPARPPRTSSAPVARPDAAIADVRRIEAKYSRYRDDSVTTRINRAAGGAAVTIDAETAALLRYADQCHAQSGGLFDITSGVLRRAWDFKRDPPSLPDAAELAAAVALVAWPGVEWDAHSIRLPRAGMEIDFGGIGKEYAADRVATICLEHGMRARPRQSGRRHARDRSAGGRHAVARRHPPSARTTARRSRGFDLAAGALATSGDYERYFEIGGRRYCHILNPKTGMPVTHWQSISVVSPLCVVAGSCATIAMLLKAAPPRSSTQQGLQWIAVAPDGTLRRPEA